MALNQGTRNEDAFFDAQGKNKSARSTNIYADLDLFFGQNNTDGDVNQTYDAQAVKRSIRNLVLTNQYEKPFHPEIGSSVRSILFEPINPITASTLTRLIGEVIANFEPRARLVGVDARPNFDDNAYEVTISFYVINIPGELVNLDVMLERSR